jgi:short-subunit dehydrogenase involved in D-alanine esterification of teichoic acids
VADQGDEAISPGHHLGDVEMVVAELDADIRVRRQRRQLLQKVIAPHRQLPLLIDCNGKTRRSTLLPSAV